MKYKLSDLTVDGKGSYGIAASAVDYDSQKPTYLRITDINDDGTINFAGLKSVDDENSYKYILKENDIVFARTGASTGRSYFYQKEDGIFVYAGFLIKFSLDSQKVNPRYLKYYTHSKIYYDWVHSFDSGATRGNINAKTFGDMLIDLPDRKVQDVIVSILKDFDDKIAVNRRICENLEAQAQALFKHWFIDFAPFKNGKFVESELGMIPEGWRVGTLGGICTYSNKKIAISQLTNTSYYSTENMLPNKAGAMEASSLPQVEMTTGCLPYDVLVSNIRPYFKKIIRVETTCGCSTDVLCFHPVDTKYMSYMYRVLYDDSFFAYVMAGSKGTKMPRGDKQQIMKYPIVIPTNSVLEKYSNLVEPMFGLISSSNKEITTLSTLRDTLLPKLMSGQIKV